MNIEERNLNAAITTGQQQERLRRALQANPVLANLLYAFLFRFLTFLAEWFMDESGNKLPFMKSVKAFFSKEFWTSIGKLQAEAKEISGQL